MKLTDRITITDKIIAWIFFSFYVVFLPIVYVYSRLRPIQKSRPLQIITILFFCLTLARSSYALISLDSTVSKTSSSVSSQTQSVAVTSGADLFVIGCTNWGTSNRLVSGVTFNGDAFTKAIEVNGNNKVGSIWYLQAPDVTTANAVVTLVGTTSGVNCHYSVLRGSNTGVVLDGTASSVLGTGTSNPVSITTSVSDAWIFDNIGTDNGSLGIGSSQVSLFNYDTSTSRASYKPDVGTAGSKTMTWTWTGSDSSTHVVAAFRPAVAPTSTPTPTPTPTGAPTATPTPTPPNQSVSFNEDTNRALGDTISVIYFGLLFIIAYIGFKIGIYIYRR